MHACMQGAAANALVHTIPRSREVGQSYITSVWTTLYALGYSAVLVLRERPELVSVEAA